MNLLFIFADQMHRFALGCMETTDIETPHLDRLASQGILFRNAYSNCPICTPFRLNLFTGLYCSQLRTFGNEASIPSELPTLIHPRKCRNPNRVRWQMAYRGER